MRQKESTTTSAHMDIDNNTSYTFMSSELESKLAKSNDDLSDQLIAKITFRDFEINVKVISLEEDSSSLFYTLCVDSSKWNNKLVNAFFLKEESQIDIMGITFISKIFKLESDKTYFGLTR